MRFWRLRGYLHEPRERLTRLLALTPERSQARAKAIFTVAVLATHQGNLAATSAFLEEGLSLAREIDDRWSVAYMLQLKAGVAWRQGRYDRAVELGEESLSGMRALGDRTGIGIVLWHLASARCRRGEHESSIALYDECIAMGHELGDPYLIASSLTGLAIIARDAGDESLARAHHEEALSLHRTARNPQGIAQSLIALGSLSPEAGALAPAHARFAESLAIGRDLGFRETVAAGLEGFAELAAIDGQPDRAVRLAGAADIVRHDSGLVMMPTEHTRHERMLEPARRSLGETAVATAWEEGRAMFVDEAIEYALATVPRRDGPADRRPAQDGSRLTPREREVAALIARGLTNQQIAAWAAEHGTSDVLTSGRSTK